MTVLYNPNTPTRVGLEFPAGAQSVIIIDSLAKVAAMSLKQTTAQTIAKLRIPILSKPTPGGLYQVDVYDGESGLGSPVYAEEHLAYPTADVSIAGWRTEASGSGSLFSHIDKPYNVYNVADYIFLPSSGVDQYYRATFGVPSVSGKRLQWLGIYFATYCSTSPIFTPPVSVGFKIGGVDYPKSANIVASTNGGRFLVWQAVFTTNPSTGAAWTPADVALLSSTSSVFVRGDYRDAWWLTTLDLWYGHDGDTRIATGSLDDRTGGLTAAAYNEVTVLTPAGAAWVKDASGYHLYTVRRISDSGAIAIPTLDAGSALDGARGYTPTADPATGVISEMGDAQTFVFGLIQRTNASADSTDSQVYAAQQEGLVYSGVTARQEFTAPATANYGLPSVILKANAATGDLSLKVRKVSDDSQVGGTLTLAAADWPALPLAGGSWRRLTGLLASVAALASGTRYYLELSDATVADDGASSRYWSVLVLDSWSNGQALGFGGTTDAATVNAARSTSLDIAASIAQASSAPAAMSLHASVLEQTLPGEGDGCAFGSLFYVHLSWDATTIGAQFDHYELQASFDGGTTWQHLVNIVSESLVARDHYEGPVGVLATYRIRPWTTDVVTAEWSNLATATPPLLDDGGYLFVSDVDPTINCGYPHPAAIQFIDLNGGTHVFQQPYGLDYQYVFVPTEDRGLKATFTVYVSTARSDTADRQTAAYAALRALARADVPYLMMKDPYGNTLAVDLEVGSLIPDEALRQRTAEVTVTQVNLAEYTVEADVV